MGKLSSSIIASGYTDRDVPFPGGGRTGRRRRAGGARRRRHRRLAAVRLPRPESDGRRRDRRRAPGRTPRHPALVLPDSRHRRAARPGPRDREELAGASARHDARGTPAAISSKPACARCSTGMRRVAMEYSPGCAIPYVARVDAGTIELVRAGGRGRGVLRRSHPALLDRLGRGRDRDASAGVREALPREGSRVRGGRAPPARRRRRRPNTTSSS